MFYSVIDEDCYTIESCICLNGGHRTKGMEYNRLIKHHLFEEGVVLSNSSGVSSVISIMRFL